MLRLTPEDKFALQEKMYKAVAPSMQQFVINMCMEGQIIVNSDLRELNAELRYDPKKKSSRSNPKEYLVAVNGNSWKIQLCVAIDHCMKKCKSKTEFKREMKKIGYDNSI